MKEYSADKLTTVFDYYSPKNKYIGILSIPHSGEVVPDEFKEFLTDDLHAIGQDVDFKVDDLVDIQQLNDCGIAVIVAHIHRTCIDLNRAKDICVLNWKKNSQWIQLVENSPPDNQVKLLTQKYYAPYFEMLKALIHELHKHHNEEISFIDLHSMPSKPTKYHLDINPNQKMQRSSFCVSDIEGLSCSKIFIDFACEMLKAFDNNVTQNDPYFGGHITRHIHATYKRINNIQIEINRGIYMDEEKRVLKEDLVKNLKPNLTKALVSTFEKFSS